MIVKPAVQFLLKDSDPALIVRIHSILTGLTGNAAYPAPVPALTVVKAALDAFTTALANAADGGMTLTAVKDDRRLELIGLVRQLAGYVQTACTGDLTILMSSNFPIQKPQRSPVGDLPTPANLTVTQGAYSGQLDASMPPIPGALTYNWQLAAAAAPAVILQTAETSAASASFTGLTPGVVYNTQANAVGTAGTTDWSDPSPKMVV